MPDLTETINLLNKFLNSQIKSSDFVDILEQVLPSLIAILGIVLGGLITYFINSRSIMIEKNKIEILRLRSYLNSFYHPYLLLSKKNTQIYTVFSKHLIENDPNYRTLIYLLKGYNFNDNQQALLKEIINNDNELNELIIKHSNIIENRDLLIKLSEMSAHYTLLGLAFNREITGDEKAFEAYVHSNEVIDMIESEIKIIESKISFFENNKKYKKEAK